MAFSHLRKAFCPITRDLSKHTTDFTQEVQVNCAKSSVAKKLLYQKNKNTCTFSNGLRIHKTWTILEKSIEDYIIEQQNKYAS